MIETVCSFAMAFWYLQRSGIPFSDLWFKFGEIPSGIDADYYNARVNEASSIYFINLVIMSVSPFNQRLFTLTKAHTGNGSISWPCALAISQSSSIHLLSTKRPKICTSSLPSCFPWGSLLSGSISQVCSLFSVPPGYLRSISSFRLLWGLGFFVSMKPERQRFVGGRKYCSLG